MSGYRFFVCPVEFNNDSNSFTVDCEPSELFQLQDYGLPPVLQSITGWVKHTHSHTHTRTPSVRHSLLMSLTRCVHSFSFSFCYSSDLCVCVYQLLRHSHLLTSHLLWICVLLMTTFFLSKSRILNKIKDYILCILKLHTNKESFLHISISLPFSS